MKKNVKEIISEFGNKVPHEVIDLLQNVPVQQLDDWYYMDHYMDDFEIDFRFSNYINYEEDMWEFITRSRAIGLENDYNVIRQNDNELVMQTPTKEIIITYEASYEYYAVSVNVTL